MANARSARTLVAVVVLGALVLGCGSAATSSTSAGPSQAASAAPSLVSSAGPSQPAPAAAIELQRTQPIGCDAIGVDYKSATIKIDPAADPDVSAQTDTGKTITVKWTAGFTADGNPPVIRGPKGEEVARDGTKIDVPADANPRLAGYFVCLGTDTLYVLETDPQ